MNHKTNGILTGACCYLSGAMEFVSDHGVGWRRKFIELLKEKNLKIDCIDPTNKPGGKDVDVNENKNYQIECQSQGRFLELQEYVSQYRRYDLRFVDLSDFLIAVIDPTVPQWGTSNEIYEAERQHKPIFFVIEGGLHKLPRWLFDVIKIEDKSKGVRGNIFETIEQVVEELILLDSAQIPLTKNWVLVRHHIERMRNFNDASEVIPFVEPDDEMLKFNEIEPIQIAPVIIVVLITVIIFLLFH